MADPESVASTSRSSADIGRLRQAEIFIKGLAGRRPRVSTNGALLEEQAQKVMSREAFAYVAGGAGTESTLRANRAAFDHWSIVPRMLCDVSRRDLSVTLFGRTLATPMLLAPVGVLEMVHPEADRAVARVAAAEGVPMIFSSQASIPMEECAVVMGSSPRWFQLYWGTSDDLMRSFVGRAEACGCEAIVLTADTTRLGWRVRDMDLGFSPFLQGRGIAQYTSDPVFRASLSSPLEAAAPVGPGRVNLALLRVIARLYRRYPGSLAEKVRFGTPRRAVQRFLTSYSRPWLNWTDLSPLRDATRLPILVKGIQHADDARLALEYGVDGVIVSNHGGRQVDGAIASLAALPGVTAAVDGRIPVLFDSGIRCGADIFKALALGATAVCIGRPYVYGLAIAGEEGVREVIENLCAELDITAGLAGCATRDDINRGRLLP
ncbi:MAG TPA: lactate 2-monooxygenase [Gemmatimonadaceae bacterium]|nr:lactate 2-monooxygenase [Gemmatimonadaceae bacterium]